jgi:hypothetical protein
MASVQLTWSLPAVGATQRPIDFTRIEIRKDGGEYSVLTDVPASSTSETVTNPLTPGTYDFRGTVFDVDGQSGAPAVATIVVPFDAPGSLTNFTAALV